MLVRTASWTVKAVCFKYRLVNHCGYLYCIKHNISCRLMFYLVPLASFPRNQQISLEPYPKSTFLNPNTENNKTPKNNFSLFKQCLSLVFITRTCICDGRRQQTSLKEKVSPTRYSSIIGVHYTWNDRGKPRKLCL